MTVSINNNKQKINPIIGSSEFSKVSKNQLLIINNTKSFIKANF